MTLEKKRLWLIIIVCALTSMGCAGALPEAKRTGLVKAQWGKSFEYQKNNQIVDQMPPQKDVSVVGVTGKAAEIGMVKYYKGLATMENVETSIDSK